MRASIAALLLIAGMRSGLAQPAGEPGRMEQAASLYDQGKAHFDLAEYSAAIVSWKEAYLLSKEPLLLFNIAQAYRLAGNCAEANRFYENYQRIEAKPSNRAELDQALEKCAGIEAATGENTPTAPQVTATASPRALPLPAPEGEPPILIAPDDRDPGRSYRIAGLVVGGAGGIATIVAIASALSAREHGSSISNQPTGTTWTVALAEKERAGEAAQTRARVAGVLGVAAVTTGIALWWLGSRASRARMEVALSPNQAEVSWSCGF